MPVGVNVTCLSISKNTGVVAQEGVVQQTFSKALEHYVLACLKHQETHIN